MKKDVEVKVEIQQSNPKVSSKAQSPQTVKHIALGDIIKPQLFTNQHQDSMKDRALVKSFVDLDEPLSDIKQGEVVMSKEEVTAFKVEMSA